MADHLQATLTESVEEGVFRLRRTMPSLLATGLVGGIDVSVGVFAMLLVREGTGNDVLAAFAFGIGFIALTLAGSELFTENFLMPVTAVVIGEATWRQVLRLWAGTASMNVVGGVLMVGMVMTANPGLGEVAIASGEHFVERGIGVENLLSAVLAGIVITLMTWMMLGKPVGTKIVAAVSAAFVLNYGELGHVVVASLEMFAGMFAGAEYGLAEWLPLFLLMAVGNTLGGIGLVTATRLVQLGSERVQQEREETSKRQTQRNAAGPRQIPLDDEQSPDDVPA